MRVLVTGGTGFLGRRLCAALLAQGHAVAVVSRQRAEAVRRVCGGAVSALEEIGRAHV